MKLVWNAVCYWQIVENGIYGFQSVGKSGLWDLLMEMQ